MEGAGAQEFTGGVTKEATKVSPDLHEWRERMDELMEDGARIIVFRGAGTVNGIEPQAAQNAALLLGNYVESLVAGGTDVVLMYDGDGDNRERPDVGSVFGWLADNFKDDPQVTAIAAQTEGWYSPNSPDGPIESATGTPYETYVFPDDVPSSHAALTQSEDLVSYPNYEQVFVGPAGPIAFEQLGDLSKKTAHRYEAGEVRVTVIVTPNNPAVDDELSAQLEDTEDAQTINKITTKQVQRKIQPFGALASRTGEFAVKQSQFPGIKFTVTEVV